MNLSDILKTEGIITVSPNDTLSHALGRLSSSHDAAFVLDAEETLIGVVNPYHCLINNSFPGNAKVAHCMTKPPKVGLDTEVSEIARLMTESKMHYLPIYDDSKFIGIISARRILKSLVKAQEMNTQITAILKPQHGLKALFDTDTIAKALRLFKDNRVSKLIVLNQARKLSGVLAFYDLISYLATPKQREGSGDRKGVKTPFLNYQVKNFMKTSILTLPKSATVERAIQLILDKKIGSIVVVDQDFRPVDIVTTKDIFNYAFHKVHKPKLQVISKNLSRVSKRIVPGFAKKFASFMEKRRSAQKATLYVEEHKGRNWFRVLLSMMPKRGKKEYITKEGRDLSSLLSDVKRTAKEIEAKKK